MSRSSAIGRAYLLWANKDVGSSPPEKFLDDPAAVVDGQRVELHELEVAVVRLVDHGLLAGGRAWNAGPMPLRPTLTADGRICVTDFDGDVDAWSRRNSANIDQSVRVRAGRDAQVTAHSSAVNQAQNDSAVNVEMLSEAVGALLSALPVLGLDGHDQEAVRADAEEIETEAAKPEPDHGRLRALAGKVGAVLAGLSAPLAKMLLTQLTASLSG
jgi:hypothetical protein